LHCPLALRLSRNPAIHSSAIPNCFFFVNENDTTVVEENTHIVAIVKQPSSIYFRCLDKTPSQ